MPAPGPLPLTSFQLTLLPFEPIRIPYWLAPLARTLFKVWFGVWSHHPMLPPTESGPWIVSLPVLVMFQTGSGFFAGGMHGAVRGGVLRGLATARVRCSTVFPNIPMVSPVLAAAS